MSEFTFIDTLLLPTYQYKYKIKASNLCDTNVFQNANNDANN